MKPDIPIDEKNIPFLILRIATLFIFLGRAWQHLFFDTPYRSIFWDENLYWGNDWNYFTQEILNDSHIDWISKGIGFVFLFCAITVIFYPYLHKKIIHYTMYLGTLFLAFLFLISFKEHFYQFAQLIEFSIQLVCPIIFLKTYDKVNLNNYELIIKIGIAGTFIGHGIYAIGIGEMATPYKFYDMLSVILSLGDEATELFLNIAGVMDFLVAIFIFFPGKWEKSALIYATIWGLLTALARIVSVFLIEGISLEEFFLNLPHTIYRFPNGLLPLALLMHRNKI